MDTAAQSMQIIVKRRKGGHGGHHGGAWKVAYADFVTAMMALFIVLWLTSSSENVQQSVAGYFRDPNGQKGEIGNGQLGTGDGLVLKESDMNKLRQKLEDTFKKIPDFDDKMKEKVKMMVTGEGLRIEFMENAEGFFFQSGSALPTASGRQLLSSLGKEIGKLSNGVLIEGHTDSKPFSATGEYSNWELSADRANAARRLLEAAGLSHKNVSQVRGFADQQLRDKAHPENPANRRISIVVQHSAAGAGASAGPADHGAPSSHEPAKHEAAKAEPAKHH